VHGGQSLQLDEELNIVGSNNILNFEIRELDWKAKLLDDASKLPGSNFGLLFILGARVFHLRYA
jgi:hypothetical protein